MSAEAQLMLRRMNSATVAMIKGKKSLDKLINDGLKDEHDLDKLYINNQSMKSMTMKQLLESMDQKELKEYEERTE